MESRLRLYFHLVKAQTVTIVLKVDKDIDEDVNELTSIKHEHNLGKVGPLYVLYKR